MKNLKCIWQELLYREGQGLKLKSMEGPHLDRKCLRGPQFSIRRALRASMWKNMPYLGQNLAIFDYFLSFIKRELRDAQTPLAGYMRPTARIFETPGVN